jgi:DNA-binding NarL/FixJ family response regulator
MSNLLPPWSHYLALQTKLKLSSTVDDTDWGIEAALDRILASSSTAPYKDIERAARSESRRERYRAGLRRQYLANEEDHFDGESRLQARQQLRRVRERVGDKEWTLLSDVGRGNSYREIAREVGTSSGAVRIHVSRLRQRIREALAA